MDCHADKVEKQFGTVAQGYLSSRVHSEGADFTAIADKVKTTPRAKVLDLGCGAGHVSFVVAPFVESAIAYDLSREMIDVVSNEAKRRSLPNISTRQGRAEALPFEDASFDWVCTRYSAHHWTDIRKAFREARRILKSGGALIIIDTCAPADPLLDTHLQTIELLRDPSHVRNDSLAEWNSILAEAGFQPRKQSCWRLPLDFNAWVRRMRTPPAYVEAIRSLLQNAPREVRGYFQVTDDCSFALDSVLIEAN